MTATVPSFFTRYDVAAVRGDWSAGEPEETPRVLHGLFAALKLAGEQVVHHEGGDIGGNVEVLLRIVGDRRAHV